MPTYPYSPTLTVDALLKQPRVLARDLASLAWQRFVADRIFARGTSEMVAGGAAIYQRAESIFPDRDAEEVGVRAEFPRTGWTEALLTAAVRKFGLEVPISFESIRRNQMDQIMRAQIKLANAVVKFVDTQAMTLLTTDGAISTSAASGDWSTAATDIVADIANARKVITDQNEGYEGDTMILNPAQELDLLLDADIRNALPRETSTTNAVMQGRPIPIMGIRTLLVTPQLTAGTVFILNGGIVGTIADEQPDAQEGYVGYAPAGGPSLYAKVYEETGRDEKIVRAARFPAMWIAEPKAAYKITGA
jgi:hypothetical protein